MAPAPKLEQVVAEPAPVPKPTPAPAPVVAEEKAPPVPVSAPAASGPEVSEAEELEQMAVAYEAENLAKWKEAAREEADRTAREWVRAQTSIRARCPQSAHQARQHIRRLAVESCEKAPLHD